MGKDEDYVRVVWRVVVFEISLDVGLFDFEVMDFDFNSWGSGNKFSGEGNNVEEFYVVGGVLGILGMVGLKSWERSCFCLREVNWVGFDFFFWLLGREMVYFIYVVYKYWFWGI